MEFMSFCGTNIKQIYFMKRKLYILALISTSVLLLSCSNDEDISLENDGTMNLTHNAKILLKKQDQEMKINSMINKTITYEYGDPINTIPPRK